jgi:hypothetical protein
MAKKRAFVRYTRNGKLVPGSLIITTNGGYPDKVSLWEEVKVDLCCEEPPGDSEFLLQENGDKLLQEDGSRIIL